MNDFDITSLKNLKQISSNSLTKLRDKKGGEVDDRYWKLDIDKKKDKTQATIRILPSLVAGELPWVEEYRYFITTPNGKYFEKSLRSIGKPDPMREFVSKMWENAKTEDEKKRLREMNLRKPSHTYIANIYVVDDPIHPENNGKVKLFRFGTTIYNKIIQMAEAPLAEGLPGNTNVTDWEEGCNLILVGSIRSNGLPTYDDSLFASKSKLTDEQIVRIANQMYDLREFSAESSCKTYEQLKEKIITLFGKKETMGAFNGGDYAPMMQPTSYATPSNQYGVEAPYQVQGVAPIQQPVAQTATKTSDAPWDDEEFDFNALMADVK